MAETGDRQPRTPQQDLEFWKHFAGMGGTDKNTMITIVSWLLAFAATAIGFIATEDGLIASKFPELESPRRMMALSLLGLGVSAVAGYLTLLYAGYTNANWAKADEIADRHGWVDLLPEGSSGRKTPNEGKKTSRLNRWAWHLARPCYPDRELAPVFKAYLLLATLAGLVHTLFAIWATLSWK